jgi:hypothetical protein
MRNPSLILLIRVGDYIGISGPCVLLCYIIKVEIERRSSSKGPIGPYRNGWSGASEEEARAFPVRSECLLSSGLKTA